MTPREKRMALLLGVLLFAAVIAGGYLLVYDPYVAKKEQIAKLKTEIEEKSNKQMNYAKLAKQYEGFKSKSLTADSALAYRGYNFLINDLISKAGIASGNSVVAQLNETKSTTIPLLNADSVPGSFTASAKDKPAYQRVSYRITLSRVDLRMVGEFLRLYYNVPILQHITSLKIQTKNEVGGGPRRIRTDKPDPEQWKDLEVTIITEAMILDGVESRKTLAAIPKVNAAALGNAFFSALQQRTDIGGQILVSQALAKAEPTDSSMSSREYAMLMSKDIFHGPLPPEPIIEKVETPPPPPKVNIDRFIKLNEITRRSDGSARIEIRDQVNNFAYSAEMTPKGEKTVFKCVRTWYSPSGKPIREQLGADLNIADDKTASQYKFKVVAIDGVEGIVLSGPAIGKPSGSSTQGGPGGGRNSRAGGGPRGGSSSRLPAPKANEALAGGWIKSLPESTETLYYLKNGASIEKMKTINASEVLEIIKRNTAQGLNPFVNSDVSLPVVEPVAGLASEEK